ncbi:MAG: flagellar brake protein [Vicinamibacterales bacterium]
MELDSRGSALAGDDDDSRYRIHSRIEIAAILRGVMRDGEMVSAHFNGGRDSFVTALMAVDANVGACIFDASNDDALNARLVASNRISFVSRHDRIKVRWEVKAAQSVDFDGHRAIRTALPESMLKFQRREFYRAETPVMRPVKCAVVLDNGKLLEVNLFDISLGGVGLTGFPATFNLEVGRELSDCTLTLPEVGVLAVSLRVRNAMEIAHPDGRITQRAGCQFLGLPPGAEKMIQRYIMRLEKERRARLA